MKCHVQFSLPPIHGWRVALIKNDKTMRSSTRNCPITDVHPNCNDVVRRVVEVASDLGARTLTLVADSSEKWIRPDTEASVLLRRLCNRLAPEVPLRPEEPVPSRADPVHDYWLR